MDVVHFVVGFLIVLVAGLAALYFKERKTAVPEKAVPVAKTLDQAIGDRLSAAQKDLEDANKRVADLQAERNAVPPAFKGLSHDDAVKKVESYFKSEEDHKDKKD